ncbi:hypothetical protein VKA52_01140 [Halobacillus sp. HZG1]|uniref:hypothetical protein n=1 Tax=Halobacillus sp. HZG1 TaxID=3111769 RepID=UPI002DB6E228|nr:hypothetical protein [Halobacillus sp. HZG1]MEC3882337.1 hypothetical protein [Halobacillus sp. HZG1]
MDLFYSVFIICAVIATFFVIFKKLTKSTYWTMAIVGALYITILLFSFFYDLP